MIEQRRECNIPMKKCPYCGKENSDDAVVCAIDQTPLDEIPSEKTHWKDSLPVFAVFSESKIPISLAVLSYLFFFPAALGWAVVIAASFAFFTFGFPSGGDCSGCLLYFSICVAVAIFFTCLSRGLRRCSRGWRTCALVIILWGFIPLAWGLGRYLIFNLSKETPKDIGLELLAYFLYFIFQYWQYRVLTRQDIKELFGIY